MNTEWAHAFETLRPLIGDAIISRDNRKISIF
jgi:hypothetical protein